MSWFHFKLRPLAATSMMTVREKSFFGLSDTLSLYVLRGAGFAAMIMIWHSLIPPGTIYDGMTLAQMLSYTLIATVLTDMLNIQSPAYVWLHEGTILSQFIRPMGVIPQMIAQTAGGWLLPLALFGLPCFVISAIAGIRILPATLWFFPSLALSVALGFAVDLILSCMVMRTPHAGWLIHYLRQALFALLSGAVIPFAVLPWNLAEILVWLPTGSLAGAPLALFTGLAHPAPTLIAQLCWTVLAWPCAIALFKASQGRMVSYGG